MALLVCSRQDNHRAAARENAQRVKGLDCLVICLLAYSAASSCVRYSGWEGSLADRCLAEVGRAAGGRRWLCGSGRDHPASTYARSLISTARCCLPAPRACIAGPSQRPPRTGHPHARGDAGADRQLAARLPSALHAGRWSAGRNCSTGHAVTRKNAAADACAVICQNGASGTCGLR